jgi:OmpA-OmpF porin, OOP family
MKNPFFLLLMLLPIAQLAQFSRKYANGHGDSVEIAMGDRAFADSLVSYKTGNPAPIEKCRNGKLAVGTPDWDGLDNNFAVLGRGGEMVLYFKDNAVVNLEGTDLYVFELGKYIEETFLSISKDGKKWIEIGKIGGGNAAVDLGDSIPANEVFRYVKLKDAASFTPQGKDSYPGADIDAVAALGSAFSISLNSKVLFNTGKSELKPQAKKTLDSLVLTLRDFPDYQLRIEGHTDSIGTHSSNEKLSANRAISVKNYLQTQLKNPKLIVTTQGYAELLPAADNKTAEGREKNRRVELFVIPLQKSKR